MTHIHFPGWPDADQRHTLDVEIGAELEAAISDLIVEYSREVTGDQQIVKNDVKMEEAQTDVEETTSIEAIWQKIQKNTRKNF